MGRTSPGGSGMTGHTASLVPDDQVLGDQAPRGAEPEGEQFERDRCVQGLDRLHEPAMMTKRPRGQAVDLGRMTHPKASERSG
jgi:hypothetical protein